MTINTKELTSLEDTLSHIKDFLNSGFKDDGIILFLPVKYIVKDIKNVIKKTFKESDVLGVDEIKDFSKSIPELLNTFDSKGKFKGFSLQDILELKEVHKQIVLLKRVECTSTITLGYDEFKDSLIIRVDFI